MMPRAWAHAWGYALAAACVGCASAPLRIASLDEVERVRVTATAREGADLAPDAFAHAEEERDVARKAHVAGDDVAAGLHAERAIAAYQHAFALARLARATIELADAEKALDDSTVQLRSIEISRSKLDDEATELEERAAVARTRLLPALSVKASGDREAARLLATRSMSFEARLLCDAARLVAPEAGDLAEAESSVAKVEEQLGKSAHPSPLDDASRARARCLGVLTHARRAHGGEEGTADVLLAELSAGGKGGKWAPSRDERGVVVTLRGAFRGAVLTDAASAQVTDLGRVAAAHPTFGVEVVVHEGRAVPLEDRPESQRAAAIVKALVAGGAEPAHIRAELAGSRLPVVDPSDAVASTRNERVEIVFVPSGP